MRLEDFVKEFVCKNSLIRLWFKCDGGYRVVEDSLENSTCMEWQFLNNSSPLSKYKNYEVIGVKDIATDDWNRESVNIIIKDCKITNFVKPIIPKGFLFDHIAA